MSQGNSREIATNQQGVNDKLVDTVVKYRDSHHQRPFQAHTQQVFESLVEWLDGWQGDIVLDSCCGVGESTATLSALHPNCRVIGVDKSALRVDKHSHYAAEGDNYRVVRADVNDLWRLVAAAKWRVVKHCLFYPNPYPKSSQLQKRWYASPAMPALMAITSNIEVRSNWLIYIQEFQQALACYDIESTLREVDTSMPAVTPFERKYRASGQACWQLKTKR